MIRPRVVDSLLLCAMIAVALAPTFLIRSARHDRLRQIVQQQCLPHWRESHDPAPCLRVIGDGTAPGGIALLHDRKGGAHFLLIPTRRIRGIESIETRESGAPNYFALAWNARDVLGADLGRDLPREAVGLGVNSRRARSQEQLHIHISCLRRQLYVALQAQARQIGTSWGPIQVGLWRYQAMRVMGDELGANPFRLAAERLPGALDSMAQYTLLVAGMAYPEGPGFALLSGTGVPSAELLLDSRCEVAGAAVRAFSAGHDSAKPDLAGHRTVPLPPPADLLQRRTIPAVPDGAAQLQSRRGREPLATSG